MTMIRETDSDGNVWAYYPSSDRYELISEGSKKTSSSYYSSKKDPSHPWNYKRIKEELEEAIRYREGIEDYNTNNLYSRINDNYELTREQKDELNNLLNSALNIYKIKEEEHHKEWEHEQEEKREDLINECRAAWKSRNFLWKFFHQKLNPKKKNFDGMRDFQLERYKNEVRKR